ncbi:8-hydroxy-dADP phosphatase [Aureococcus anophagefferens]|uniref:8-hydroxy-dADP phosphatase n=1 Tax=Aureococcus anophagefferens TaxID=44056 RepID=A0ABR1FS94_AURAN
MASLRVLVAALCAAGAYSACREPHPSLPYYHPARESPKLAVLGMYYNDLPASHVPTADQFKAMLHGPAIEAAFERISDGCLTPETFSPDFFVVPNQGASHPVDGFLCGKDGQPEGFFETSELWDVGFDLADYDGVYFAPIGHCITSGSAGVIDYAGLIDGRRIYDVAGIFLGFNLDAVCEYEAEDCDFDVVGADPYWPPFDGALAGTYVHELLHWMGAGYHSNFYECADPKRDLLDPTRCPALEYGDAYSLMGTSSGVALNLPAYTRYHFGWLGEDDVEVVQTRGEFRLAAVDAPRGGAAKRFAYLPESDLYVHWRSASDLRGDPATPEPADEYAGFFVHRWQTLVDAHVTSCAAGADEVQEVTLKPNATFLMKSQGVVLRAGEAAGDARGLEVHLTGEPPLCVRDLPRFEVGLFGVFHSCDCGDAYYCEDGTCGDGGYPFRPFRSYADGVDRVGDYPGGVTLHIARHLVNTDWSPGCEPWYREVPFTLAVARTELPEGYGFDAQVHHMELRASQSAEKAFAFGLPADVPDGDYDTCLTATNEDTGLRAAILFRLTLPHDRGQWWTNNRPAEYAGVDPELAAYCASLNGCGRADGDCVGWVDPALHPPDHCDLELSCDGDDAGFGPEGRCWGDGASWRGRDQCGVDQSFCVGGAPLLDAPLACDDPLPPPCLGYCFEDETIWNKFVDAEQLTDGNCGGQHALCAGDLSANEADSLWGTPFCETEHLMPCAPNGSHYSSGHLTNRHRCWQNGGDAADIACARALCEATPECGGYTISTPAYAAESYGKVLWFQTVAIERPDGDNWRYECWRKPQWETKEPCHCNAPGEQTQPAGACASPGANTTTTTAALSAAPSPAPSEAVSPAPSEAPKPAPSPAPTGDAVAAGCEDDAAWLAKSNKKAKKKCLKKTTKKKCKKKCAWIEDACVEKLQTCEDTFYKKGKPQKEGAKLAKACKKQGTIGGAKKKVKASAACQKACGTCDEAGAVVGATTTTAGFANDRRWCPTPRPSSAPTPTPTTAAPSPAPTKFTVSEWTELTTPDGEEGHCTPYGMLCDTDGAAYGSALCDDFYTSGDMMGSHPCKLGGWDESVACVRELCEGSELCGGYTFSPGPYWWSVSLYPVGFGAPTYRLANTHCWKKPDASSAGAVVGASTTTAAFAGDLGEGESCGYGECAAGLSCDRNPADGTRTCVRIATDRGEGDACGPYWAGWHYGECAAGLSCECAGMCADPMVADYPTTCVRSGDGPSCESKKGRDSESWHRKDAPTKTCEWVKKKPSKRCRKKGATGARAETECVRACASCPSEGACADDATWSHTNKKNKKLDCVSVARNPGRRCGLSGAADACRATCVQGDLGNCKKKCAWVDGACVEKLKNCEDSFYNKKGKPNKEGAKLAKACKKKGTLGGTKVEASATCQKACGTC